MPSTKKNLLTETELATLAEKLANRHSTEDDLIEAKEILSGRNLIVMTPYSHKVPSRGSMTLYQGHLTAFTTVEKCVAHTKATTPNENYIISAMPFLEASGFAERQGLQLYIDVATTGPFFSYRGKELVVTRFHSALGELLALTNLPR